MDNIEGLGKRLKDLRDERDMSLDMVVYDMNNRYDIELTKSHLSRWERGKCSPSLFYAAYLCKYYNISLDYLIGRTKTKAPVNVLIKED